MGNSKELEMQKEENERLRNQLENQCKQMENQQNALLSQMQSQQNALLSQMKSQQESFFNQMKEKEKRNSELLKKLEEKEKLNEDLLKKLNESEKKFKSNSKENIRTKLGAVITFSPLKLNTKNIIGRNNNTKIVVPHDKIFKSMNHKSIKDNQYLSNNNQYPIYEEIKELIESENNIQPNINENEYKDKENTNIKSNENTNIMS